MRPVNLIPSQDRGQKATVRSGPIAFLLVGALALALAGVTLLVLKSNDIGDKKAEIASLEQQEAEARAQAEQLSPFAQFNALAQSRRQTVESLADSRFDWERVLNELALVIPSDVWLVQVDGAASAGSSASESTDAAASVGGPNLQLVGCAAGQESVAGFLSALRDIDGVTRVGLTSSERPSSEIAPSSADSGGGGDAECRTKDFIAKFQIVAAFDEAPVPAVAVPAAPAAPAPATPAPSESAPAESTPAPSESAPAESTPAADTGA